MKRTLQALMPDTVVTRAVAVLVVALIVITAIGYMAYRMGVDAIVSAARERELSERISSITQAISVLPSAKERELAAHALTTPTLEIHWATLAPPVGLNGFSGLKQSMIEGLRASLKVSGDAITAGYARYDYVQQHEGGSRPDTLQVSIRLEDSSWLWFLSHESGLIPDLTWSSLLIPLFICASIILSAVLSLRWVTHPLRLFAEAAERFSLDTKTEMLAETGPIELRTAARAMNMMLQRISVLVQERTQALAALSHDLRTPITRIRLRNELLDDDNLKEATQADLAEMDAMIQSTLDYLRSGGVWNEPTRTVDVASILRTICDEQLDLGYDVEMTGPSEARIAASPIAIKRAFNNIIGNACKYGENVRVNIEVKDNDIEFEVHDEGPGIPAQDIERVFEPFYRIETSRSRSTGGSGLGLTIARNIIMAHGGGITLANRRHGGLRVFVELPRVRGGR